MTVELSGGGRFIFIGLALVPAQKPGNGDQQGGHRRGRGKCGLVTDQATTGRRRDGTDDRRADHAAYGGRHTQQGLTRGAVTVLGLLDQELGDAIAFDGW